MLSTTAVPAQNQQAPIPIPPEPAESAPAQAATQVGAPSGGPATVTAATSAVPAAVVAQSSPSVPETFGKDVYQQIVFATGSAQIPQMSLDRMSMTVTQLQQVIGQDKHECVEIVSYTNLAGEGKNAAALSDQRAWAVHSALLAHGLSVELMRVVIPPLNKTTPALAGKVVIRLRPR
ncbi:MAG: OmpA family protein [Stenotrophobium sp.]